MRALLSGLLLLPFLLGCGGNKVKVSGRVLYNGNPLPGGIVSFRPAEPKYNAVTAELDEEGNYEAMLPPGEVQVAVDNRELQPLPPAAPAGPPPGLPAEVASMLNKDKPQTVAPPPDIPSAPTKHPGRYVPIPAKFYTTEKSGITFTVDPGNPKQDIELK